MAITQKNREMAIGTQLGDNVLLLVSMSGTERLGRPFEYELELASEKPPIKASDIVGTNVTIRLDLPNDKVRYFNGYISSFTQTLGTLDLARYRATVVPWLWFLTRTADCHIFQEKNVPEIIEEVFAEKGFSDYDASGINKSDYRVWEYCVQYRETDFNFVSRLMEQEGIYYYFEHEEKKHTLKLADSPGAHDPYPDHDEIKFRAADLRAKEEKIISDWVVQTNLQPGWYALDDFDFKNIQGDLMARQKLKRDHKNAEFEIYDYPGEYTTIDDGNKYAKKRIQELHAQYEVITAASDVRGICTGYKFNLIDHPRDDQNQEHLITSANYTMHSDLLQTGGPEGGAPAYSCSFTAIKAAQQFRAPRITPKPSIPGPQTALVVGKSGEEIWTDKYGRVKVQFHWDRRSQADDSSSCWIRVAQVWAGKNWGAMHIPRIGQEVIVEFLEGDPDQPIITGRVYNAEAMPPYELPGEQTKSTLKSNSSKGGGGFNEIRFEDKKGKEQIFIHAQQDADTRIGNDFKEYIGNEKHLIVKKNQLELVEGDKHLTVKGNQNEKIDGTISIQAGSDIQEKVGMNYGLEAGSAIHIKGGMNVVIEAGLKLSLKAGSNFIDISPAGVAISGTPTVLINSGGAAGSGAGCTPDAPEEPKEADTGEPGGTSEPPMAPSPPTPVQFCPQATTLQQAAADGTPFCEECEKAKQQQASQ
jgi:type VI secretion system secreted protein VgrG